jgi:hypothetical protein
MQFLMPLHPMVMRSSDKGGAEARESRLQISEADCKMQMIDADADADCKMQILFQRFCSYGM